MSSRERVYRTETIVLRRFDLGEADRILTLYSRDRGKLKAVAKGVRRPGSRKSGHLEPFTQVDVLMAKGRDLDVITQAQAIELFIPLRDNLERLGYAAYSVELLDQFTVDLGENRSLYDLLLATLRRLANRDEPLAVLQYYELRLLDLVGYRPELFHCLDCNAEIQPEDQFFSAKQGGVLCPQCGPKHREAEAVSLAALKVLRHYQRSSYDVAAAPGVSDEVHMEVDRILEDYITHPARRSPPLRSARTTLAVDLHRPVQSCTLKSLSRSPDKCRHRCGFRSNKDRQKILRPGAPWRCAPGRR